MKIENDLNKTIITDKAEVISMMNYCKNSDGDLKREFYDWYLTEGTFFLKSGMFIVEMEKNGKCCTSFNFENPEVASFRIYNYGTQRLICAFHFKREENLEWKTFKIEDTFYNKEEYKKLDYLFHLHDLGVLKRTKAEALRRQIDAKLAIGAHTQAQRIRKNALDKLDKHLHDTVSHFVLYAVYATMYYFSQNKPSKIIPSAETLSGPEGIKVPGLYKYTGYIDLKKPSVIYTPKIKKESNEPKREYNRHIQAWTVRGHYRRTSKGLIWIDPHVKGEGEVENRVYGTEEADKVNIRPKVFEVMRNVKSSETSITKPIKEDAEIRIEKVDRTPKRENPRFITRVKDLFKKVFSFWK